MKKRTIILLAIAFISIVSGTIGASILYKDVKQETAITIAKSQTINHPETAQNIEINLRGNSIYEITAADTDEIIIQTYQNYLDDVKKNTAITEENDRLAIDVFSNLSDDISYHLPNDLPFNAFKNFSFAMSGDIDSFRNANFRLPVINITIPKSAKNISIRDNSNTEISLSNLTAETIDLQSKHASIYSRDIEANLFKLISKSGNISVYDGQPIKQLTITNTDGDTSIFNSSVDKISISASSGDILLNKINANSNIQSKSGNIQLNDVRGDIFIKTTDGTVELENSYKMETMNIETTHGDINGHFYQELKNIQIIATSNLGSIYLVDAEQQSFKEGNGASIWKLKTDTGDIDFTQY